LEAERISMMFSRRKRPESGSPPAGSPDRHRAASVGEVRVGHIRLYQPDPVLATRLPNGVGELAAYINTLKSVANEYFGGLASEFGSLGMLVVVGIKPGRRVKFWCEQVEGDLPPAVWDVFVELLEGAGEDVRPTVTGPVAFAIEFLLGAGPQGGFPIGPAAWQQTAAEAGHGSLAVPDGIFETVFPD
jgi:hypothetical protein